ncbi:prepilin-type N-terminal cleavage/methylation domain-containing protein [Kineococcus auxinigenes]|uniref:prepilin-type N-terminal cleavage/methylation domain-containing protein n=1 Tax=unclassified Kineococcus TaxID=2621656 RepID=UPI003D7D5293
MTGAPASGRLDEGFTLVELLVVLVILGVLAAIAVPASLDHRRKAADAGLKTDLRTIAEAQETYFTDEERYLPVAETLRPEIIDAITLTSGTSISVTVSADGSAYCVVGTNPRASHPWVHLSNVGGQQPGSQTACPSPF